MRRICLTGHIMMGGSSWGFIFLFLFRVSSSLSLDADLSCKVALGQKRSVADDRGEPNEGPCDRKLVTMIGPPGSDVAAGAAGEFQAGGWGGVITRLYVLYTIRDEGHRGCGRGRYMRRCHF